MPSVGKALDIPHNFVVSWAYELPFGPGRRFLSDASGVVQRLVEGWSINGITMYQSGQPLNIRLASSQLNTGTDNFANVTCDEIGTPELVIAVVRHELLRDAAQLRVRELRDRPGARAEVHQHRFLAVQANGPRRHTAPSSCGWRCSTCSTRPTSRTRTIGSATPTSVESAARGSPRVRSSWARGSCSESLE